MAGYKCFTPNCEYDQGVHSLITTIQVYDEEGKLKTRVDAPTNPVVWGQQKRPAKGAVSKQQVSLFHRYPLEKENIHKTLFKRP